MTFTFRALFLAALVVWVGEIVFFSFVVAPALFRTLPAESAGQVVAAIFRWYYRLGVGAGVVLIASAVGMALRTTSRGPWLVAGGLVTVMLGMTLYAAAVIQPRVEDLRPQLARGGELRSEAQIEFDRLHRRAVQLNGLTLLLGLGVGGVTAAMLRD